ncbi:MAG: hypothetical protein K6T90_21380 [Leptolyngbyaceae cyanobacterium HOT.MB2.61]|nr:hypothetical protein [Leptolyngbyaceae cyanobacterium HOT.MB2.61]
MYRTPQLLKGSLKLTLLVVGLSFAPQTIAQVSPPPFPLDTPTPPQDPTYPTCQPPNPGEYILLIKSGTPEAQDKARRALPASARSTVCSYLDDVVTRVSGFTTVDTANAWVRYLNESAGLSAFVARPRENSTPEGQAIAPTPSSEPSVTPPLASPPPSTVPVSSQVSVQTAVSRPTAFNPTPLGAGYAVLVNYFNQPELALEVQQLIGKDIGLVSYGQRPYLLAIHTADQASAHATLQKLTDRGFWAMVVDSRRVTLLRQTVNIQQSTAKN